MTSDPLTAFLRVVVVAAAIGLVAPACGSRPIAAGDGGGDAATAGTSGAAGNGGASGAGAGNGGASGRAGSGGSGGGGGNATAGSAGTSGIAGATGGAGSGGAAGSGASGGRGGSASGGSNGGASGGRGGSASGGSNGGASGGRGGSASGGSNGGTSGGRGGGAGTAAGGRGGAGGTGVPGPECATASDCKLVSDCCTCEAVPVGATVAACPPSCQLGQCEARQLPSGRVACVAGRCVAGFACDSTNVTCRAAPPTCAAGMVPAVNDAGNCYLGTCAPESECASVAGCGSCTGAGEACVTYETQLGNQHHCVAIPPECNGAATCGCFGAATCLAPYRSCVEYSGLKGVACSCPNC